jgi:hypothetical protein
MSMFSKALHGAGHFLTNHYDDLGTAAGFVGGAFLGQPMAGAAIGRGIGSLIGPEHAGHKGVGLAVKEGLKGAAMGAGADALGLDSVLTGGGEAGMFANPGDALEKILGRGGDAVNYLTDKDRGAARTALVTGIGQLGLGAYAGNQAGRAEEEQQGYDRRNDPIREKIMQMFLDRFSAVPRVVA